MRRMLLCVALLHAGLPLGANAQSADDRLALIAFRDSIASSVGTATRARLAEQHEELSVGGSPEALARIRAGYLRLLTGQPAQAEKDFGRAARLQPTWPVPWLGLGDAHAALGIQTWENTMNLGTRPGLGEFRHAAAAYGKALALDPGFTPAIERELSLAIERRDTALLATAVGHAHRLPAEARTPSFLLALSLAEWRIGHVAAARAAVHSVPDAQRTPAIQYALARATLAAGDASGVDEYWRAVSSDDPEMLRMLRQDLALIATAEELGVFDAVSGYSRQAFLEDFWAVRAGRELRPPTERLEEHYERIAFADRHFGFDEVKHVRWSGDVYSYPLDSTFDSRGVVYVRQGPPNLRLQPSVLGFATNETWAYYRGADTLVLHFASQHTVGDFQLVESVEDISDFMKFGGDGASLMELARSPVSDRYAKLVSAGRFMRARLLEELREQGAQSIATSTTTDAHPLRFADSVHAFVLPLAIGEARGGSEIQVAVALVEPEPGRTRAVDTLRLRFGASDRDGRPVGRLDSTITYPALPQDSDASHTVFAHFHLTLPQGAWSWTAAVQAGDSVGSRYGPRLIEVPLLDGSTLAVSDLAIGTAEWSAPWETTPADTARLTPFRSQRQEQPMEMYYEVYGVPAGASYQTQITARQGGADRPATMRLGFEGTSRGTPTRVARTILIRELPPGAYLLEVQVTTDDGAIASSSRPITIIKD